MNVGNAIQALRAGWILRNPESWKQRTVAINALTAVLSVLVAVAKGFGYDLPVSDEILAAVATGVWGVVGVFNSWSTVATTDKIGVRPKGGSSGVDGSSDSAGPYP